MMSASIEERREVAKRLRGIEAVQFDEGELVDCGEVEAELGLASDDGAWYRLEDVMRLADLIEPAPERTCMPDHTAAYEPGVEEIPVCSECGRQMFLEDDDAYCPRCGAKVIEEES